MCRQLRSPIYVSKVKYYKLLNSELENTNIDRNTLSKSNSMTPKSMNTNPKYEHQTENKASFSANSTINMVFLYEIIFQQQLFVKKPQYRHIRISRLVKLHRNTGLCRKLKVPFIIAMLPNFAQVVLLLFYRFILRRVC